MTQHYGMRQLALRKSLSASLGFLGLTLFTSSWGSSDALNTLFMVFATIFAFHYFGGMVRCHKYHIWRWSIGGVFASLVFALLILWLSKHQFDIVRDTAFDETAWAQTLKTPYAETHFALIESIVIGISLSVVFGMLGLNKAFEATTFKATGGIFLGITLGFTPGFVFFVQNLAQGGGLWRSIVHALALSAESMLWITVLTATCAAALALGELAMKTYKHVFH